MKKWLLCFIAVASAGHADDARVEKYQQMGRIMDAVAKRAVSAKLTCVTPKPVLMYGPLSMACASMPSPAVMAASGPHTDRYIKVYITAEAEKTLSDGTGIYPEGTLIVKEKCRDAEAKDTELFTAMVKRERGYNPTVGDWEFMVLDRDARVTASGKIESCMDCHQNFAKTDFVSHVDAPKAPAAK